MTGCDRATTLMPPCHRMTLKRTRDFDAAAASRYCRCIDRKGTLLAMTTKANQRSGIAALIAVPVLFALQAAIVPARADGATPIDATPHVLVQAEDFGDSDRAFEINPDAPGDRDGATSDGSASEDDTPRRADPERNDPERAEPEIEPPGCNMREGPLELLV